MLLRSCRAFKRSTLLRLRFTAGYSVVRAWSSSPSHAAGRRLNQLLATRNLQGAVQRDLLYQEYREPEYFTALSKIMRTLRGLGVERLVMAERLLRMHRSQVVRERSTPPAAAQKAMKSLKWKSDYEEELTSADVEIMTNHKNLGLLFYAGGMTDLSQYNLKSHFHRGRFSLQVAFELGYREAAIDFARIELNSASSKNSARENAAVGGDPVSKSVPVDLPLNILDHLKRNAMARNDWRAMTLYLDYMTRRPQNTVVLRENFQLAMDLSAMVRPSHRTIDLEPPLEQFEQPWFLLQKVADAYHLLIPRGSSQAKAVQKAYRDALNAGRDEWDDIRAARLLLFDPQEAKPGSKRWLDLLTQSAMQGDEHACFTLGDHYIKEEGWHPHYRKGKRPTSRMGLWWIEASASAASHVPKVLARRHLLLAVLLRENGFEREAHSYIVRGQNALKEFRVADADKWVAWLQSCIDKWDSEVWDSRSITILKQEPLYQDGLAVEYKLRTS